MRVPVNLASHPADNTRPLRIAAVVLGLFTLALGLVAVRSELQSRNEFRSLVDQKSQLESNIDELEGAQKEMQSWLGTTQVVQIRKRSALLNSLINQKSLSWTRLFQDLESTLPAGVRIVSIRPKGTGSEAGPGQPELGLTVAAKSVAPIVEFIRRMEDSPEFANPVVESQRFPTLSDKDSEVEVAFTARYVQSLVPTGDGVGPADRGDGDEPHAKAAVESDSEELIAGGIGRQR